MKLNSRYTMLWVVWLLAFGAIEWSAIKDVRQGDTLSEHIWKIIGTKAAQKQTWHWFLRIGVLALLVWLIVHFMTGWTWFRDKAGL